MRSDSFRHDINGLRAIAVVLVVLFHMGLHDWKGGFVGVDVFFVISGYLIIPRLNEASLEGDFSFTGFIGKRIRRLVPAAIPVIIFSCIVGLFWFGDAAFIEIVQSAAAAAAFVSNIFFMLTRGYFERAIDQMLLLHTWSLGVEFQFYLLAPLVFMIFRKRAVRALILATVASFAVSVYLTEAGSTAAYYSILSRFWQLAIGGLIGIFQQSIDSKLSSRWAGLLRPLGLALIIVSALNYDSRSPYPGWAAVLPTLASCLVLMTPTGRPEITFHILGSRLLGWLGTRSYSIYLWHWPLIVLQFSEGKKIAAAVLAVVLGEISYRFVELPTQRRQFWRRPLNTAKLAAFPIVSSFAVLFLAQQTAIVSGLRDVLPLARLRSLKSVADPSRHEYLSKVAELGFNGEHGICSLDTMSTVAAAGSCLDSIHVSGSTLIIGDSHARDMLLALRQAYPDRAFVLLHQSGCTPASYKKCFPDMGDALPALLARGKYRDVILASRWPDASVAVLESTFRILAKEGIPVIVIGPGPVFSRDISDMLEAEKDFDLLAMSAVMLPSEFKFDVFKRNQELSEISASYHAGFVDRLAYLCEGKECLGSVPGQKSLMYIDSEHLTLPAISYLAGEFSKNNSLRATLEE